MRIGEGLLNYNRSFEPVARTLRKLAREGLIRYFNTAQDKRAFLAAMAMAAHQ